MIKEAYQTAENSAGSAMKEQATYEKSIQYSLDRIGASFEQLSSTVIDSGLLKFLVDLGNTGVNAINGIVNALTPLGTVGAGLGIGAFIKNLDWLKCRATINLA